MSFWELFGLIPIKKAEQNKTWARMQSARVGRREGFMAGAEMSIDAVADKLAEFRDEDGNTPRISHDRKAEIFNRIRDDATELQEEYAQEGEVENS